MGQGMNMCCALGVQRARRILKQGGNPMKKRLLSLLLCLCMVLSMVPAALAEDTPGTPEEAAAVAKIGEATYATIAAALEAAS